MAERKGEKIGWTLGWLGGFVWVGVVSIVFLAQGKWLQGILGLILFGIAIVIILLMVPWRHPSTPYWKLMLLPYLVFFASVPWAIWAFGGINATDLDAWNLAWLVPLLIPFGVMSKRTWDDRRPQ